MTSGSFKEDSRTWIALSPLSAVLTIQVSCPTCVCAGGFKEGSEGMKVLASKGLSMLHRQSKVVFGGCHALEAMDSRACYISAMARYRGVCYGMSV
jgi:hypothetical protein